QTDRDGADLGTIPGECGRGLGIAPPGRGATAQDLRRFRRVVEQQAVAGETGAFAALVFRRDVSRARREPDSYGLAGPRDADPVSVAAESVFHRQISDSLCARWRVAGLQPEDAGAIRGQDVFAVLLRKPGGRRVAVLRLAGSADASRG